MTVRRVEVYGGLSNMPRPRLRWTRDGTYYCYLTAEIACAYSDPVVAVSWHLPVRLAEWIDRLLTRRSDA